MVIGIMAKNKIGARPKKIMNMKCFYNISILSWQLTTNE